MLIVAGGAADPHHARILAAAARAGVEVLPCLWGADRWPRVRFDVPGGRLVVDGAAVNATALWLRHDRFAPLADARPEVAARASAWTAAWTGWGLLRPDVRWLGRGAALRRVHKVEQLARAAEAGLQIPATEVSNDLVALASEPDRVAKPAAGGGLCVELTAALGAAQAVEGALPQPATVQPRLDGPEVRAYVVGETVLAWRLHTDALDHRADPRCAVSPTEVPAGVASALRRLCTRLGLDFAAADLKRCPDTGELVFLEINSEPMWEAYDLADGRLADAIVAALRA